MSGFNIAPKNVFRGTNSDGTSFRVNEYDFNTYAGIEVGKLAIGLLAFGLIAPFVSVIFFLIAIWNFDGRPNTGYPLSIILSTYFLYDAYKGWLVLSLVNVIFPDENTMNWFLGINAGIIICSIYLWLFGQSTLNILNKIDGIVFKWLYILLIIGVGMLIGCYQANKITDKYPSWVHRNLQMGDFAPETGPRAGFH